MYKNTYNQKQHRLLNLIFVLIFLFSIDGNMESQGAFSPQEQPPFETVKLSPDALKINLDSIEMNSSKSKHPKLDTTMAQLAAAVSMAERKAVVKTSGLRISDERVHVQIVTHPEGLEAAIEAVNSAGGYVTKTSQLEDLIQGWLPVDALEAVAAHEDVFYIRRPAEAVLLENDRLGNYTTEGLAAINANAWHTSGYKGAFVKIGIIDGGYFGYTDLLGSDLPETVTVRNFVDGEDYLDVDGTTEHGTACAEIIYDIAPDASLYLVKIGTDIDFEQAVYVLINTYHVDIISSSLGFFNLTPGDGTGKFENLVKSARDAGILWITAAGNEREMHWGGAYRNDYWLHPDGDYTHYFDPPQLQNINFFGDGDGNGYLIYANYDSSEKTRTLTTKYTHISQLKVNAT